ncbi:MAG: glycogen/starch synthase, partial [Parcubacteria group bacterium]|nr:glycogen/starch synthase [Parcubacteria group bacterium]
AGHIPDGMSRRGIRVIPVTYFYPADWQTRSAINYHRTPACRLFDLAVDINFNRETVPVFGIARGESWVYGINNPAAGYLYPGEKAKKLEQAAFLGRAVPALLKRLGEKPDIIWCQEWMAGLVIPNMRDDPYFCGTKYLFTLHTPAREALEEFPAEWYGKMALHDRYRDVYIRGKVVDISSGSVKLAHLVTGVSEENGEVLRAMFPEEARENKVFGIMNGVSRDFMLSPRVKALADPSPQSLWEAHRGDKEELLGFIREKTGRMLNPREPLVALVRRLAEYKNQKPMFEGIVSAIKGLPRISLSAVSPMKTIRSAVRGCANSRSGCPTRASRGGLSTSPNTANACERARSGARTFGYLAHGSGWRRAGRAISAPK